MLSWVSKNFRCRQTLTFYRKKSAGHLLQEETDNLAALEWKTAQDSCFHFELNEKQGVAHLELPFDPSVLARTVNILFTNPKDCTGVSTTG